MELKDQILARMYVAITLISLLPILVALQVLRVTALEGPDLRLRAKAQATEYEVLPAIRGEIFDTEGRPLAVNIERVDVALDPTIAGFSEQSALFFDKLSHFTTDSASRLRSRVRTPSSPKYVNLVRDVRMSQEELDWFDSVPGVILLVSSSRRYNHGSTASHVLGVAGIDAGQSGLELEFDEILSGRDGQRVVHVDRLNRVKFIPGAEESAPVHGESLYLSLDLGKQSILEEELSRGMIEAGARSGSAVAIDPRTGAILAMANFPTFDPNYPGRYDHAAKRNGAVTDKIEPGSVIKIIPAVAALETGVVSLADTIDTGDGTLQQGRFLLEDTHAHGRITFSEVISLSSNVGTALVVERIPEGVLYQYARQFGFNQKTGIELPGEASTTILKVNRWDATTRSAMSRGYAIHATLLQIAMAYGALANGGLLMKPYIVRERRNAMGQLTFEAFPDSIRRVFKKSTADELLATFEAVVSKEGTAPLAQVEGLRIAGKTGTAQKAGPDGYIPGKYRATFVGFYPVQDPQIVLAIVLDEPSSSAYGGVVAGPIFKRVTERWMARMPELARYLESSEEILEESPAVMPDVHGLPVPIATRRLRALGLRSADSGKNFQTAVLSQNLAAGKEALSGVPVDLSARPDSITSLPDFRGLSKREAVSWMASLNIDYELKGYGLVLSQSPDPGSPIPGRVTLRLN